MPSFAYEAINSKGITVKGNLEADNIDKAQALLKGQELIPVTVRETNSLTKDLNFEIGGKPKPRDFSIMCRQFVSMTQAGVSLIDALNMLSDQTENKRLQKAIREIQADVEKGESLTVSMQKQSIMPPLLCSMVGFT